MPLVGDPIDSIRGVAGACPGAVLGLVTSFLCFLLGGLICALDASLPRIWAGGPFSRSG